MKPLLVLAALLPACSGTLSTVNEGYAYRMTPEQASSVVDSAIRSHVEGDRMHPGSPFVASGYDRSLTDTQTYRAVAVPVPRLNAFGFEVSHEGTMFNGPTKARRIFGTVNRLAGAMGNRVSLSD